MVWFGGEAKVDPGMDHQVYDVETHTHIHGGNCCVSSVYIDYE
jgi:hypothetical protein